MVGACHSQNQLAAELLKAKDTKQLYEFDEVIKNVFIQQSFNKIQLSKIFVGTHFESSGFKFKIKHYLHDMSVCCYFTW